MRGILSEKHGAVTTLKITERSRDTFIIRKDKNIIEAAKLMRLFNVGNLIVVTQAKEGNMPIGILTDRDIVMHVVTDGSDPGSVKVTDIMSK
jgi:predicted transcriptional regulator